MIMNFKITLIFFLDFTKKINLIIKSEIEYFADS